MELITLAIDFIMHIDRYLEVFVQTYGQWVYALLFLIIFVETGLVVMPFLPGDSLLFVVGVALGVGFGYWLVARGPMGKALQTAGAALEENARAFTTLMRTITDQNEQIIALQNSVDEALDAKRAIDQAARLAARDGVDTIKVNVSGDRDWGHMHADDTVTVITERELAAVMEVAKEKTASYGILEPCPSTRHPRTGGDLPSLAEKIPASAGMTIERGLHAPHP